MRRHVSFDTESAAVLAATLALPLPVVSRAGSRNDSDRASNLTDCLTVQMVMETYFHASLL